MAKNIVAAQVSTSIMEGTESTYSVDIRDYLGEGVDSSLVTLRCKVQTESGEVKTMEIQWDAALGVHVLTLSELPEGRHHYEIYEVSDTGEQVVMVQGYIGVFNADNWQEPAIATNNPNRTLRIMLADDKRSIEAQWLATSAAEGFAYQAKKYAKDLEDAMPTILAASEFMQNFNEALRKAIKVYDNELWIGGENTHHKLKGEDGLTPHIEPDGYWYIGDKRLIKAQGEDGITPHITSDGYWAFGSEKTDVRAEGRDGLNGSAMRRILIPSKYDLPEGKEQGVYYYVDMDGYYDVYVWLEGADAWVCVGEANDIATMEVHGLMKFTAGSQENGAPVGWKKGKDNRPTGEAMVPLAGMSTPGSGKIGTEAIITQGAPVGFNSSNAFYVNRATTENFGVVKIGTSNTIGSGGYVGLNSAGMAMIPYASTSVAGVIKIGTSLELENDARFKLVPGITRDGVLGNNLLLQGALKVKQGDVTNSPDGHWARSDNLGIAYNQLHPDRRYFGLDHTEQFTQEEGKLELLSALYTGGAVGGVRLSTDMEEEGLDVVPSAAVVRQYFENKYGQAPDVLTRKEAEKMMAEMLESYATQVWVQDSYTTKSETQLQLKEKMGCQPGVCEKSVWISASDFNALSKVDPLTEYKIYAG